MPESAAAISATFQRETLEQAWADAQPLLAQQADELAPYPDIKCNPDMDAYKAAEAAGALRIFTVRATDAFVTVVPDWLGPDAPSFQQRPELLGYAVFFVRHNPHYRDSMQAVQDVIWLAPEHRHGGLGRQLVQFCDEQLGAEGVQPCFHHVKLAHPELGLLLQSLGYEPIETIWAKRLDR